MELRTVQESEYKQAAYSLARAFRDDPVSFYFTQIGSTSKQKANDLHEKLTKYIVYAHILKGHVLTIGRFEAVALWMPPGRNMDAWSTIFRSGLWRIAYQLSFEGFRRFTREFFPLLTRTKLEVMGEYDDKSWYLSYVGTLPDARRHGYAAKLITHVTAQADARGEWCYLESSHHENRPFYERLGFTFVKNIYLTRSEKPICIEIMVRQPTIK